MSPPRWPDRPNAEPPRRTSEPDEAVARHAPMVGVTSGSLAAHHRNAGHDTKQCQVCRTRVRPMAYRRPSRVRGLGRDRSLVLSFLDSRDSILGGET